MIFLFAFVIPLAVVLSPICANMRVGGKAFTFLVLAPLVLFLGAMVEVSTQSPAQEKATRHEQAVREVKELQKQWKKEAEEKAQKDFHNAMRPYTN